MRTRTAPMVFGAFLALALLAGCGPGKYVPTANEEIYGTWTNPQEPPHIPTIQKAVYAPGSFKGYNLVSSTTPQLECSWEITGKWKDSEGNVWYKGHSKITGGTIGDTGAEWVSLYKLSKSASVLEEVLKIPTSDQEIKKPVYPVSIDPKDDNYHIKYRAKE